LRTRRVSLRQLRYFVAVAETGKVSEAARLVSISQSTITTALQDLEDVIGVPLLERSTRGTRPTFKGYQLLQRAYQLLNDVDTLCAIADDTHTIVGRVQLGVTDTVAAYFLPGVVTRFKRAWPSIEVEVRELPRDRLESSIEAGEIDLGLVILTNAVPRPTLSAEVLARMSRHLWVSQDHPLLDQPRVSPADIARQPYVMLMRDQVEAVTLARFAALGLEPRISYRVSSVEAVRSLVANGAGVTILADLLYRPWSLDGRRVEKLDAEELFEGEFEIGILWPQARSLSAAAIALRDFVRGMTSQRTDVRSWL
jgi:DNA-binding transcriptional LysR family regulator